MNEGILEVNKLYYFILDEVGNVIDGKLIRCQHDVNERLKQLKEQHPTSKFIAYEIGEFFYFDC